MPTLGRGWLRALIRGIRQDGVQARDPRVKALWDLLRRRQLLTRDPWVRTRLRAIWQRGLVARQRPRAAARILALLRNGRAPGVRPLPPRMTSVPRGVVSPHPMRRLQPVALRRVATLRPVGRPQVARPPATTARSR
jgi:hypothetical protein